MLYCYGVKLLVQFWPLFLCVAWMSVRHASHWNGIPVWPWLCIILSTNSEITILQVHSILIYCSDPHYFIYLYIFLNVANIRFKSRALSVMHKITVTENAQHAILSKHGVMKPHVFWFYCSRQRTHCKTLVSDLRPLMEVAQITTKNVIPCGLCCSHCSGKKINK